METKIYIVATHHSIFMNVMFICSKLLVFSIRYASGVLKLECEHRWCQVLHGQARELVYKVFSYSATSSVTRHWNASPHCC